MKHAVLDTNVLISSFGWDGNEKKLVELALSGRLGIITSPILLDEFCRVAARLGFDAERLDAFIDALLEAAFLVSPAPDVAAARDAADNRVLECALEGKADFIVTGDSDLLVLKEFRGIKIVTAAEMLKML